LRAPARGCRPSVARAIDSWPQTGLPGRPHHRQSHSSGTDPADPKATSVSCPSSHRKVMRRRVPSTRGGVDPAASSRPHGPRTTFLPVATLHLSPRRRRTRHLPCLIGTTAPPAEPPVGHSHRSGSRGAGPGAERVERLAAAGGARCLAGRGCRSSASPRTSPGARSSRWAASTQATALRSPQTARAASALSHADPVERRAGSAQVRSRPSDTAVAGDPAEALTTSGGLWYGPRSRPASSPRAATSATASPSLIRITVGLSPSRLTSP
jgi:hypothetical protein